MFKCLLCEYFCPKKVICNKVMKVKNQVPTENTSGKIQDDVKRQMETYPDHLLLKFHVNACQITKKAVKVPEKGTI